MAGWHQQEHGCISYGADGEVPLLQQVNQRRITQVGS
jgi:hypothetical protein